MYRAAVKREFVYIKFCIDQPKVPNIVLSPLPSISAAADVFVSGRRHAVLVLYVTELSAMKRTPQISNLYYYDELSLSLDPNIMEVQSSSASTSFNSNQRRKRRQLLSHDIIEVVDDDDQDGFVIIGENLPNKEKKQPMDILNCGNHGVRDFFPIVNGTSSLKLDSEGDVPYGKQKVPVPDAQDFSFHKKSAYGEFQNLDDFFDEVDYGMDVFDDKSNLNLAAQFVDLNIPPGIEATLPWFQDAATEKPTMKLTPVIQNENDIKFKAFKQFDNVRDHSDHYFNKPDCHSTSSKFLKITPVRLQPGKDWAKSIQHEWKVLEQDLPETIYVRVYEDRMDLLRAVIIGPAGTPYHDGLFFFDIYFPPTYPYVPPMVHYHSGGLRLNPNLYECGKVCLSLLNTWSGHGCERWDPSKSTMLQVMVSIQALVLNSKPYFNEPGYANLANTPIGEEKSLNYNENTFILSCKTMLYSLRNPPKHFEDFVAAYFGRRGRTILMACRAYIEGAQVGCVVGDGVQDVDEGDKSSSSNFKKNLSELFEQLLMEFTAKGVDCSKILSEKVIK